MTGIFATAEANPNLNTNLATLVRHTLWVEQLKAIGLTLVLSTVGTAILAFIVKAVIGLRPDPEIEESGLDEADHGEVGYHYEEAGG